MLTGGGGGSGGTGGSGAAGGEITPGGGGGAVVVWDPGSEPDAPPVGRETRLPSRPTTARLGVVRRWAAIARAP